MICIRPLTHISFENLYQAFNEAFKDYEVTRTSDELLRMLLRRGYDASLSFGAFDGDRLVSFTLNATGRFYGRLTAYDTGTGTLPDYRGQGLATAIFKESAPVLQRHGIKQYLLEVLQHNTKAVSLYEKIGFRVSRELNYFIGDISPNIHNRAAAIELKEVRFPEKEQMAAMWEFLPSWQNSFDSILRTPESFKVVGAYVDTNLAGYGILDPGTGDVPQIAVSKTMRRRKIGTAILKELMRHNKAGTIRIINTQASYAGMTSFIEYNGISQKGSQYEMVLELI